MATYLELAQALVSTGYVSEEQVAAAAAVLAEHLEVEIVDAEDTREFATKDLAYQQRVIDHAEEMAKEDLSMGDIEDRFVQAEVIESAASLAEKDLELIKRADKELAIAFKNASGALVTARLIDKSNAEKAAALLAEAWESTGNS
jgi:membrane-bound lytic murein transglycosylase B